MFYSNKLGRGLAHMNYELITDKVFAYKVVLCDVSFTFHTDLSTI